MKSTLVYLLPVLLLILCLTSCNNSDTPFSPTESGKGFIKGKVHPRTEFTDINSTDTIDYPGFLAQLDGTNFSTVSDSAGNWFFDQIPVGNYTISFSKTGYSKYKQTGVIVVNDDTLDFPIYLYKYTNARMSNFSHVLTPYSVKLNYTLSVAVQRDYYVRFYFSLDSNVGNPISNYTYSEADLLFSVPITPSVRFYDVELVKLYQNGMTSGKKVYFYGNVAYKNQYYLDSLSGRRVYNANSEFPTQKISVTLP